MCINKTLINLNFKPSDDNVHCQPNETIDLHVRLNLKDTEKTDRHCTVNCLIVCSMYIFQKLLSLINSINSINIKSILVYLMLIATPIV